MDKSPISFISSIPSISSTQAKIHTLVHFYDTQSKLYH